MVKKFLPLIIILVFLVVAGVVFLARSPVLILNDLSFTRLYGPTRLALTRIKTSLSLFRPVIPVTVSEGAAPSLLSLAVEGTSKSPLAVIFPYRYIEGARFYRKEHPDVPILVMGGRIQKPKIEEDFSFIRTDLVQDFFRAGLGAAVFAGESREIVFFTDGIVTEEYKAAFRFGLRTRGFLGDPIFLDSSIDYSSYSNIGCVVVTGPASKFLERNLQIPVIYFSWADPTMTPRMVKLIFDDSPWALARQALKYLDKSGEEVLIPSVPIIRLEGEEKKNFRIINDLIKEEFQEK